MQVSVCIATYQRNLLLERLLTALQHQTFEKITPPQIEIIVADNDRSGGAKSVCERLQAASRWPIHYDIEPAKGVTHARNRTITNASAESDFIAIIDDDEEPAADWLEALLLAQQQHQADVVQGPVQTTFEETVPSWVEKGQFFEPRRLETGHLLDTAFTNNVLVRAKLLKALDPVFDDRFAVKGAEDSYLFMKLRKDGAKIVWCQDAVVCESIPSSRTNFKWLLERNFWGWSSFSLFEKELYPSFVIQSKRAIKGVALVGIGTATLLPAALMGKHKLYGACFNVARGAGTLAGLLGRQGDWQS